MNSNRLTALIIIVPFLLLVYSCKSKKLLSNSEKNHVPIDTVKLDPYKSPQERQGQDSSLAVGIAISGGGSRAQYFSTGVLIGLDEVKNSNNSFLNEIDYFSTVSGGGFGAGYYLILKKIGALEKPDTYYDFWISDVRKNKLKSFMAKKANPSSVLKLWRYERNLIVKSYPKMVDEELLQYKKQFRSEQIKRTFLHEFFIPNDSDKPVTLPMFVTNGTVYNNGERISFMPHILDSLKITGSYLPNESFKKENNYLFPMAYAIAGSAAFPGVLPMLKLEIDDKKEPTIRIIDGGAVDNLGFTTLFELLSQESVDNKKALIIDCSGLGLNTSTQPNKKVGISKLLQKSLMYTVDTKLMSSNKDIIYQAKFYNIKIDNIVRIGISDLKKRMSALLELSTQIEKDSIKNYQNAINRKNKTWEDGYKDLVSGIKIINHSINVENLSELPTSDFEKMTAMEVYLLYELASQIETKIYIGSWEDDLLVLAGRYVVKMNNSKIQKLIN